MKGWAITIIIVVILAAGGVYFALHKEEAPVVSYTTPYTTPAEPVTPAPAPVPSNADLIQVNAPKPNDLVKSPLTVTGKARGTWYFEASFPVRLEDANGK